jgi:hypothetical protein
MAKPYWFTTLAKMGRAAGITPRMGEEAREWYREKASQVRGVDVNRLISETKSRQFVRLSQEDVGSMITYWYDPKGKDTLPYWDQAPLVFPLRDYGTNFLGINLHYLPPLLRARLMNALYETAEREDDKIKRLNISYNILRSAARFSAFKPCLKEYIKSHVRSKFMYILPKEWDMALMLPTQRFVGATTDRVWRDSRRIIRGN